MAQRTGFTRFLFNEIPRCRTTFTFRLQNYWLLFQCCHPQLRFFNTKPFGYRLLSHKLTNWKPRTIENGRIFWGGAYTEISTGLWRRSNSSPNVPGEKFSFVIITTTTTVLLQYAQFSREKQKTRRITTTTRKKKERTADDVSDYNQCDR